MPLFPTKNQWSKWSLPSKLGAIGAYVGIVALCLYFIEKAFNLLDYIIGENESFYNVTVHPSISAQYFNNNLMCMQEQNKEITLSPIRLLMSIEVTNLKKTKVRIQSYKCSGYYKVESNDISTEGWYELHSMPLKYCTVVYFIKEFVGQGIFKGRIIEFTNNNFDKIASNTYVDTGESIIGWTSFEVGAEIRNKKIDLIKIKITIKDASGDEQTFIRDISNRRFDSSEARTFTPNFKVGHWIDLTDKSFKIKPKIDPAIKEWTLS